MKATELITMKTLVRIEKDVPLTIFDEPSLKKQANQVFEGAAERIKARVEEILEFLGAEYTAQLSLDNITFLFKAYFYKFILNEAVEVTLTEQGKYNILSNILSLLSEENLKVAIMGKPMIDAFTQAIRSLPADDALKASLNGSKVMLLKKEFLGIENFPTFRKKDKE